MSGETIAYATRRSTAELSNTVRRLEIAGSGISARTRSREATHIQVCIPSPHPRQSCICRRAPELTHASIRNRGEERRRRDPRPHSGVGGGVAGRGRMRGGADAEAP
jgi:hypothetical protein